MIRFSLRSRGRAAARQASADRAQSPPGSNHPFTSRGTPIPSALDPPSFLANYDALPTRRPDGFAMHYATYSPSRFHKPPAKPYRRGRHRAPPRSPPPAHNSRAALDLAFDLDSLHRNKSTPPPNILNFLPIEKRIHAKIAQLRTLLAQVDSLGQVQVLKDLVAFHEANLANHAHATNTVRSQIKEAKFIAGIMENPVLADHTPEPRNNHESRSTLIRKVSGNQTRHFSGRTVSALKSRTASMRSNSRNHKNHPDVPTSPPRPQRSGHYPPGHSKVISEMSKMPGKVSRKSSARLKRLGSAGGLLIRRLSKVSITEDVTTEPSAEALVSSTFDQETMKKLKACPAQVLAAYEADLNRVHGITEAENEKLQEARRQLGTRRSVHDQAMAILDEFYGSMPGWEEDPIALRMLPETVEMTEAGYEAERDLAEVRHFRDKAFSAYDDNSRGLRALRVTSSAMSRFIEDVEKLLYGVEDPDDQCAVNSSLVNMTGDKLSTFLKDLEKMLKKCVQNVQTAAICCTDAPRVDQIERDLGKLAEGYLREADAVLLQGFVLKSDFAPTLQVAKATLCDCKLAETFIGERCKMIGEDLDTMDGQVERYEEYVMMERVGLLDMFHPVTEDG